MLDACCPPQTPTSCTPSSRTEAVCLVLKPGANSKIAATRTTTVAADCTQVDTYVAKQAAFNPLTGYTRADEVACGDGSSVPYASATNTAASSPPTAGTAVASRIEVTAAGTIAAGKQSITFVNVGTTAATVLGANLNANEAVTLAAYFDPVSNTFMRLPSIAYTASVMATLHISLVN